MNISGIIQNYIEVPDYIEACADAVRSNLLYGPNYAIIGKDGIEAFTESDYYSLYKDAKEDCKEGDKVEEVYTGLVGGVLRDFIENLPSELYIEEFSEDVMEVEPEGYWEDEDEEEYEDEYDTVKEDTRVWIEPEPYVVVDREEIVAALFGRTIAREFE